MIFHTIIGVLKHFDFICKDDLLVFFKLIILLLLHWTFLMFFDLLIHLVLLFLMNLMREILQLMLLVLLIKLSRPYKKSCCCTWCINAAGKFSTNYIFYFNGNYFSSSTILTKATWISNVMNNWRCFGSCCIIRNCRTCNAASKFSQNLFKSN